MQLFPPTIIIRHRRENLKKCSLRGLESRADFKFYIYPKDMLHVDLTGYILLALDAPPLTAADGDKGLCILDGTWRYAAKMLSAVASNPTLIYRSLPDNFRTAYPRRQEDCSHPERGLASVEALYISHQILNRDTNHLLDNYYWKERFLELNNKLMDF
jgi:pre-rRNA-processing protein TSR3